MRDGLLISLAFAWHLPHQHIEDPSQTRWMSIVAEVLSRNRCICESKIEGWRYTFSQSFFEQNVSPTVKIIAIFDVIFESKVTLTATWFYHWRFRRAFSNKISPYSWNYCDFQRFFFQNKARNAGRSGENTGMREISQNAGFPARLRDGWHLSMVTQVGSFILVYVECKVAIQWLAPGRPMTTIMWLTRRQSDDCGTN